MNVGPVEIVIVLVLALLVFGPKQLPQMGRTLGRGVREFRHAADTARTELGLDDVTTELGKAKSGLDDLKAGVDVKGAVVGPPPKRAEPAANLTPPAKVEAAEAKAPEVAEAPPAEDAGHEAPQAPTIGDDSLPGTSTVPGS